jgi:thioredoxin reductase
MSNPEEPEATDPIVYDVVIAGGGPAALQSALTLGRARKRVRLCDFGPPRNAAAVHVQNFVTRDGIPPAEFRRIAREQLKRYPNVETKDALVEAIAGERGAFDVRLSEGVVHARRVLLCTGMIDQLPAIAGFEQLWGTSIFACPYCHGWEIQDRRFAYLATDVESLGFALLLRGWTRDLVVLTNAGSAIPREMRERFASADISTEERAIARLVASGEGLAAIEFSDGGTLPRDVLFARPAQRQVELVRRLGLALDEKGFVRVNDTRETSIPGIYAAGDLVSAAQAAVLAAAAGMQAAAALNQALTAELAVAGALVGK